MEVYYSHDQSQQDPEAETEALSIVLVAGAATNNLEDHDETQIVPMANTDSNNANLSQSQSSVSSSNKRPFSLRANYFDEFMSKICDLDSMNFRKLRQDKKLINHAIEHGSFNSLRVVKELTVEKYYDIVRTVLLALHKIPALRANRYQCHFVSWNPIGDYKAPSSLTNELDIGILESDEDLESRYLRTNCPDEQFIYKYFSLIKNDLLHSILQKNKTFEQLSAYIKKKYEEIWTNHTDISVFDGITVMPYREYDWIKYSEVLDFVRELQTICYTPFFAIMYDFKLIMDEIVLSFNKIIDGLQLMGQNGLIKNKALIDQHIMVLTKWNRCLKYCTHHRYEPWMLAK